MGNQRLYLISPGTGSVASQALLPMATDAPAAAGVPNYDTDRNNQTGLTLLPGAGAPTGEQRFGWTATSLVRFHGRAGATLWVSGPNLLGLGGNLSMDVELRRCTGGTCSTLVTRQANSLGPLLGAGWASTGVDFGAIDQVLAPGDSLELVVRARGDSSRDVWLAYDSTAAPSSFDFQPT